MPALVPELADRCVVVNGVAKTYAMTGWRVGWLIGPDDVVKAATNLQSHATSNVANVSQVAALAAVSGDLSAVAEMRDGLRPAPPDDRRDAQRDPRRRPARSREGAFYVYPSVKGVLGRTHPRPRRRRRRPSWPRSSSTRSRWRWSRARRSARPGYLRLSYALGDDDLVEGVTRIARLLGEAQ